MNFSHEVNLGVSKAGFTILKVRPPGDDKFVKVGVPVLLYHGKSHINSGFYFGLFVFDRVVLWFGFSIRS